jgi:hypothetical protein
MKNSKIYKRTNNPINKWEKKWIEFSKVQTGNTYTHTHKSNKSSHEESFKLEAFSHIKHSVISTP